MLMLQYRLETMAKERALDAAGHLIMADLDETRLSHSVLLSCAREAIVRGASQLGQNGQGSRRRFWLSLGALFGHNIQSVS